MSDRMQLVVATPCFGWQVSSIYASSIFALQRAVHRMSNLELKVHLRDGDALITRACVNLVALFLDHVGPSVFRGDVGSQFVPAPFSAAEAA